MVDLVSRIVTRELGYIITGPQYKCSAAVQWPSRNRCRRTLIRSYSNCSSAVLHKLGTLCCVSESSLFLPLLFYLITFSLNIPEHPSLSS